MTSSYFDKNVHVLKQNSSVWSVLKNIADSGLQEEAFYICDVGEIIKKYNLWKTHFPRIQPFYATKCNDSALVLKVLAAIGTGFDCSSKNHILKILSLGVTPTRIFFGNPAKQPLHIQSAVNDGVSMTVFYSEIELQKIKNLFPGAKLVIRITSDTSHNPVYSGKVKKFGCDAKTEALGLLQLARDLNLEVVGVSFHVGSDYQDLPMYRKQIALAKTIFDFANTLGYSFSLLNIGGGFPGDRDDSLEEYAQIINKALDDYFPDPSIQIISEPGRFFVTSALTLATKIHLVRDVIIDTQKIEKMYCINEALSGSFYPVVYEKRRNVPQPLHKRPTSQYYVSTIWGQTCAHLDMISEEVLLPETKIGDWMIFEDMGAYTLANANCFSGFPVTKVCTVADRRVWLMLKNQLPKENFVVGEIEEV